MGPRLRNSDYTPSKRAVATTVAGLLAICVAIALLVLMVLAVSKYLNERGDEMEAKQRQKSIDSTKARIEKLGTQMIYWQDNRATPPICFGQLYPGNHAFAVVPCASVERLLVK